MSRIEAILGRLERTQQRGNQWEALCPAHEDRHASLSLTEGDDGRVLVSCHAGCETSAVVEALGLRMSDLMPATDRNGQAQNGKPRIVATYDYRDEAGELLYQAVRFEPKDFRQRRPDGSGWSWTTKGLRRVLYRLPELLNADSEQTVYIVEGEKDVDSLAKCGLVATCNVGGASKWRREYAEYFRGRHVVILPDNDDKGREHAEQVAQSLQGVARSVKTIELPGLPHKGDVSDWLDGLGDAADPMELLAELGNAKESDDPNRIELIPSSEFAVAEYRQRYLVRRILVANQPAIVGGRSKTMKTTLLADLALSLGTGTPFLGEFEAVRSTVAIISGESGQFTLQETARRIAAAKGVDLASASVFWGFRLPQLANPMHLQALETAIGENSLDVLMIDPAYLCLLAGTQGLNAANVFDMGPLLLGLSELGQRTGCTMIVAHHCRKHSQAEQWSPPDLEELSMAGFGEWARQWLLLGRREAYTQGTGEHRLWLNIGGSAGHSGCYAVDIDEGRLGDDFTGRKWNVAISTASDAHEEARRDREQRRAKEQEAKEEDYKRRLRDAMSQMPDGETENVLRSIAGLNARNFGTAIRFLMKEGRAETCSVIKGNRTYPGYRPLQSDKSDKSDSESDGLARISQTDRDL